MRNFGKSHKFGGSDHDRPVMTKTTCSKCGKVCEVPFRPNGRKPVLCHDCFRAEGGGQNRPGVPERLPDPRPMINLLTAVNAKLDRILKILEPEVK